MRTLTDRRRAIVPGLALAAGLMAAAPVSDVLACGYDDPRSASRGFLNWIYPDSLHVIGAISREVAARRLPLANFDQTGPDLFGHRFRLTKMSLDKFGEMLRAASPKPSQTSVSMVLVEPMLWTRFEPSAVGLHAKVHVSGSEPGDLVLISGEAVIGEIANGRLTIGEADKLGLIRFYGSEEQEAEFVDTYQSVGLEPLTDAGSNRARQALDSQSQQAAMSSGELLPATAASSTSLSLTPELSGQLACGPGHH
jgi:hypothetical protein